MFLLLRQIKLFKRSKITHKKNQLNSVSCGDESGGGKCVAPNQCVCGYLHAQSEDGGCYSLRADGVKGAFMALGVMMVSISFCGGLQTYLTKGQKQQ